MNTFEKIVSNYVILIETNLLILFNIKQYRKIEIFNNILNYLFAMLINANNTQYIVAINYLIKRYIAICCYIEENDLNISIRERVLWTNMIKYYVDNYKIFINSWLNTRHDILPDAIDSTE